MPAFTTSELDSGIVTLRLIQSWSEWVYRRVDYMTVDDVVTVHVQSEFLTSSCQRTPTRPVEPTMARRSVYVPLAFFDKQRMTRFSLRDERNAALSILIQPRVARIGAATLWAQAQRLGVAAPGSRCPRRCQRMFSRCSLTSPASAALGPGGTRRLKSIGSTTEDELGQQRSGCSYSGTARGFSRWQPRWPKPIS